MVQLIAVVFLIHLCVLQNAIQSGSACRISEFACKGGKLCLPLDRYCDGRNDCGDQSDEPKHCTGKLNDSFRNLGCIYLQLRHTLRKLLNHIKRTNKT